LEILESRTLPAIQPVSLADPSLWGATGLGASSHPSISADGQLIAFQSDADNLVPNDTNGLTDVFVYNRSTGAVTLVSVGPTGVAGGAADPVISPDGRYVAFESNSRGILPSFANDGRDQLFLRDLQNGTTSLLTVNADNTGGSNRGAGDGNNLGTAQAIFSADSHQIAFLSNSSDLTTEITYHNNSGSSNLFERDLTLGQTSLVSVSQDGTGDADADVDHVGYSLSADGRFVVFASQADNLAGPKYNEVVFNDVFVRDMQAGVTSQISINRDGTGGANTASNVSQPGQSITADGRYVVFNSTATDLVPGSVSGQNVYWRDLQTGTTTLISADANGVGLGQAFGEIISPDGRYIAFRSGASLLAQDTNGALDVYVFDTSTHKLSLASVNTAGNNGGNGDSGFTTGIDGQHGGLVFSADGSSLVFRSTATNLTPGVSTSHGNLYLRNLTNQRTLLLTPNQAGADGGNGDPLGLPALSADGRYIVPLPVMPAAISV
jgi:Tol biopolymer transport system component